MGRVTVNPFGANSRYDGLGLTGFYDYGYSNKCTPDSNTDNATCGHIARAAALAHYTADDLGHHRRMGLRPQCVQPGNLLLGQRTVRRNRHPQRAG